jgi:hypothetical protein
LRRGRRGVIPVLLGAALLVLLASPASWWARYTLVTAGIGCAMAAGAVTRMYKQGLRLQPVLAMAALTSLTAVSMWWSTNPTFICPVDTCETDGPLSAPAAFRLLWDPHRTDSLWPWALYGALDRVPDGAMIAVPATPGHPFIHPLIGERGQRRVVAISDAADVNALAETLWRTKADFVLLNPTDATGRDLALAARHDPRFELRTAPKERMFGADVFAFDPNPVPCRAEPIRLSEATTAAEPGGTRLAFRLQDGCNRPMADATVELFAGQPDRKVWDGDHRAMAMDTNAAGKVSFLVPRWEGQWRLFARYDGGDYDMTAVSPITVVGSPVPEPVISACRTDGCPKAP